MEGLVNTICLFSAGEALLHGYPGSLKSEKQTNTKTHTTTKNLTKQPSNFEMNLRIQKLALLKTRLYLPIKMSCFPPKHSHEI